MARGRPLKFVQSELALVVSRREAREQGLEVYFTGVPCKYGHISHRSAKYSYCMECNRIYGRERAREQREKDPEEFRKYRRRLHSKDPIGGLYRGTKSRARVRGISFTITLEDLELDGCCQCCGREMFVTEEKGYQKPHSPSLDRLIPKLGYIPGNVNVICWRCNDVKRNSTLDELRTVVAWLERMTE